ncbi:MAG: hypothetical protein J6A85_05660 [Clostridia bacterium]|nr:hypothetical protein [Clostridia bacterium]
MANFKYSYNEDDERPAEPVGEYKVKTALPNQVLVTAIVSYLFYGWFGIVIAIFALQKVRAFHRENEGVKSTMVTIAKVLAILNLVLTGIMYTVALGYYFLVPLIYGMYSPEVSEAIITPVLSFISAIL